MELKSELAGLEARLENLGEPVEQVGSSGAPERDDSPCGTQECMLTLLAANSTSLYDVEFRISLAKMIVAAIKRGVPRETITSIVNEVIEQY